MVIFTFSKAILKRNRVPIFAELGEICSLTVV